VLGLFSFIWGGGAGNYKLLQLPSGAPPAWVYPIIWTLLYFMIGSGMSQIFVQKQSFIYADKVRAAALSVIMLIFNIIWYPLFFGVNAYLLALIDIIMICMLTFFLIYYISRLNMFASILLVPYLLWCLYALYLNLLIFLLN